MSQTVRRDPLLVGSAERDREGEMINSLLDVALTSPGPLQLSRVTSHINLKLKNRQLSFTGLSAHGIL